VTQPLKVVQIIMCRLLGVATVVLTTNVSGREDLFKKFTTFLSPSLLPDSLYKDRSEGGHSGPILQVNAPPSVSLPDAVTSDRRYRYERILNRTTSTLQLELVSYDPIGADRLRAEPIIINLADIAPKHHDWVTEMLLKGACLVANNTSAAIDKARNLINMARAESFNDPAVPVLQFTLTIDEADDFIRTDMCARLYQTSPGQLHPYTSRALHTSRALSTSTVRSTLVRYLGPGASSPGILLEHALKRLCRSGPLIKFDVTATLLAIYLMLQRMQQHGRSNAVNRILADDIIYIQPSADYVGTESFVPLKRNDHELYLLPNELNNRNDFCSSKVEAMYDDAAGYQRSLLLDVTSPTVTAAGNIYTKADNLRQRHSHAVTIVVAGNDIVARCGRDAVPADAAVKAQYLSGRRPQGREVKVFGTMLTRVQLALETATVPFIASSAISRDRPLYFVLTGRHGLPELAHLRLWLLPDAARHILSLCNEGAVAHGADVWQGHVALPARAGGRPCQRQAGAAAHE